MESTPHLLAYEPMQSTEEDDDYDQPENDSHSHSHNTNNLFVDEQEEPPEICCPICQKPLAQYCGSEEENLRTYCKAGCRLPWTPDSETQARMLALAKVRLLTKYKFDLDNPLMGPPRCLQHGLTSQLAWYRYKHFGDRQKQDQDPLFKLKKFLHDHFFWVCGLQPRKNGGSRDFVKSAETEGIKAQNMEKRYVDAVIRAQRSREIKQKTFSNEYLRHLLNFEAVYKKEQERAAENKKKRQLVVETSPTNSNPSSRPLTKIPKPSSS